MILFGSAFFTDVIGVQAIFGTLKAHICALNYLLNDCMNVGAFLTGLIVPREGGLAIAMTEKLEDMVTIIFLPLVCSHFSNVICFVLLILVFQFFTLSGLSTDLGLLNNGKYFSTLYVCDGLICNTLIRDHMGVYHRYHINRFCGQIRRLCICC